MATQTLLYLQNQAAPYTPATIRGAWDATASAVTRYLGKAPSGSATSIGIAETTNNTAWDVLLGRWISDPVTHDQVLSGDYILEVGALESNASANIFLHLHVYVTQGDSDTPRGTLLTDVIDDVEVPTSVAGRLMTGTISSLAISKGDRVVIEVGYRSTEASATSRTGTIRYGGTAAVDLEYGDGTGSATTRPGWFLLPGDLFADQRFKVAPVRINRAHPLAKGLIVDLAMVEGGGAPRNLVTGLKAELTQDYNWERGPRRGMAAIASFGNAVGRMPTAWFRNFRGQTTIAFWVKLKRQRNGDGAILDNQWGGGHGGLQCYIQGGSSLLFIRGGSQAADNALIGNTDIGTDVWHFMVFTQDWVAGAGTQRLYMDAVEDDSGAMTNAPEPPTGSIYFLCASSNQSQAQVEMSQIRFWNRVLNVSEIKQLYKNPNIIYKPTRLQIGKVGFSGTPHSQTINETITVADTITKAPTKVINQPITIVDSVAKTPARSLFDRLKVYDSDEFYKEDFGIALDSGWNNWGGANVYIFNNSLTLESGTVGAYYGIERPIMDFNNRSFQTRLVDKGNLSITSWEVYPTMLQSADFQSKLEWGIANGPTLFARIHTAGTPTTVVSIPYVEATHVYFRIRVKGTTYYFDTSVDGETWTNHYNDTLPWDASALIPVILVGTWQAEGVTTSAKIDDIAIRKIADRNLEVLRGKVFNEVITVTDSITRAPSKVLNEIVTVVASMTKTPARSFLERINIKDERRNLVENPGAEVNDTDFWDYFTTTGSPILSRDTSVKYQGAGSFKIDANGVNADAGFTHAYAGLKPGTYALQARVRTQGLTGSFNLVMRRGDNFATDINLPVTVDQAFTLISGTFVVGEGEEAIVRDLLFGLGPYGTAGQGIAWVDNIHLERVTDGAVVPTYFDGDTSGAWWEGTAHNSISYLPLMTRGPGKGLSETITIVETFTKATSRSLAEVVTIVASITKNPQRSLNETVTVVATMTKTASRSLNETVTVVASLTKAAVRSLAEAIGITDSITKTPAKNINETIVVQDTTNKTTSRNLNENVTVTDTVNRATEKTFNETITVTDRIDRALTRSFTEVISIVDRIVARIAERIGFTHTPLSTKQTKTSLKQKSNSVILKQKK